MMYLAIFLALFVLAPVWVYMIARMASAGVLKSWVESVKQRMQEVGR